MFFSKQDNLYEFARTQGFSYINADTKPALVSFLKTARRDLRKRTPQNLWHYFRLRRAIRRIHSRSESSEEAIARSYDQEYGGKSSSYGYASIILSRGGFELITGFPSKAIPELQVIDIGAGSNEFLRFCRDTLDIPSDQLHGSDISEASRNIIEIDGFTGHLGRLEELNFPGKAFDLAYLSYFIDYDTDQAATFSAAIDLIKPGGRIVLEGLFPVRPFGLLKKDIETYPFVTKGVTVEEDITLVMESFEQLGKAKGRDVSLNKVVKSYRFVRSHYGFCSLPSYFLTFQVL